MSQGLKLIRQGKADKCFLDVSCCAAQAPTFAPPLSSTAGVTGVGLAQKDAN